jgi:hypothetical protein
MLRRHNMTPSKVEEEAQQPGFQDVILNQAQAAAQARDDPASHTIQEGLWQNTDLTTIDTNDNDAPPPAYGRNNGEIRNEKEGYAAGVAEDGRVNIRINRRLSQLFTPALRQQLQAVEDNVSAPPLYIPAFLGGAEGVPPPPPLNVVMHVVGSRGGLCVAA